MTHPALTPSSTGRGPLKGITVLDLTLAMAGPMCTQRLGEMGATVIKIEAPNGGDFSRRSMMADINKFGDATCFVTLNRNKRSLVLDLKSEGGRETLYRLAARADVLVQNYRPRVATKLGIDFATLHTINPRLVYAQISGYGEDGPLKDRPGQDLLLQSFTGLTMNGGQASGLPHPSPLYMVDVSASHLATEGVLAALVARGVTGKGQEVKVSMIAAIMEMQTQELTSYMAAEAPPTRSTSPHVSIWMEPPYGIYRCASGYLALAQADLDVLAEVIAAPDLKRLKAARPPQRDAPALAAWRDDIYQQIEKRLLTADSPHWDTLLTTHGLWCGVVNDYAAFLGHPQTQAYLTTMSHPLGGDYRTVAPAIHFSDDPQPALWTAPAYGSDSRAVLLEAGFSAADIEQLIADKAVFAEAVT